MCSRKNGLRRHPVNDQPEVPPETLDYGFSGNWLRTTSNNGAQSATLTLTDLPAHTHVNLDFLLAALDSIDSDMARLPSR
ncbi:MAG: hypothetical protein U1E05_07230 [Patescibacteria group bacterium]|nr:hypothetical protein [Patescibacteria group bacterium]